MEHCGPLFHPHIILSLQSNHIVILCVFPNTQLGEPCVTTLLGKLVQYHSSIAAGERHTIFCMEVDKSTDAAEAFPLFIFGLAVTQ